MKKNFYRILSVILSLCLVSVCMIPVYAEGEEVTRVSCTVYGDTATQRGFCWYTKADTETKIAIYDASGKDVTAALGVEASSSQWEGNYAHKVIVSGLTPGASYTYKVGDGAVWSAKGSFKTDDGDDKLEFGVIADVQASSAENFASAANVVKKALELNPEIEFLANCGDYTNDCTNEEWDLYAGAFDNISLSLTSVPVTGNHDGDKNWFRNLFALDESKSVQTKNGVNYSFDYGNAHFAVVNTNDMLCMTDAQLTWLKNDMNGTSADWKIVFMHKSPYSLGKDGKWPDALYLQQTLTEVCDQTNVDLVMSGHDHMYLRTKPLNANAVTEQSNGTTYVLSGTAGTKRYQIREFSLDRFMPTEFIDALTVQKDGYANSYNGTDFSSVDQNNVGGCYNTVTIDGGKLTLNSYVVSDQNGTVKNIDKFEITKPTGENTATYSGANTTSSLTYAVSTIPSFMKLAVYAFLGWLPQFILAVPDIIKSAANGTF